MIPEFTHLATTANACRRECGHARQSGERHKPLGTVPNEFMLPTGRHRLEVQARNAAAEVRIILLLPRHTTTVTANPLPLLASPTVVTADATPGQSTDSAHLP
jgi:hypothetical protein